MYVAIMWWYPDGTPTFGFWYAAVIAALLIGGGICGLIAPESFRTFYFGLLSNRTRSDPSGAPRMGWGWGSPTSIRVSSVLAIAIAVGFMSRVLFFTVPARVYEPFKVPR